MSSASLFQVEPKTEKPSRKRKVISVPAQEETQDCGVKSIAFPSSLDIAETKQFGKVIFNVSRCKQWLILDESTVLSVQERRQLQVCMSRKIKNPQFNPLVKRKLWDGSINFLHKNKFIAIGLWKELMSVGKEFNMEIQIKGLNVILDKQLTLEEFTAVVMPHFDGRKLKGKDLTPRPYQVEAAWNFVRFRYSVADLATNAGKTLIVFLVILYLKKTEQLNSFLMIVPKVGLVDQGAEDFFDYGIKDLKIRVGCVYGGSTELRDAEVVIGTFTSLANRDEEYFKRFDVLCVDEAHQTTTASHKKIIGHCKNLEFKFGLTGTLINQTTADYWTLLSLLGPVCMQVDPAFLAQEGFSTPLDIRIIVMNYMPEASRHKLKDVRGTGDPNLAFNTEKRIVTQNPKRFEYIVDMVSSVTKNSLVLFSSVAEGYGKRIYDELRARCLGKEIFYIDGETSDDLREIYKQKLKEDGDNKILVATFGTYSTGISISNLHNVFLVESYKSEIIIGQSIGRMMRTMDGKARAIVIDFVDDFRTLEDKRALMISHKDQKKHRPNYLYSHGMERMAYYARKKHKHKIYQVTY